MYSYLNAYNKPVLLLHTGQIHFSQLTTIVV